MRHFSLSLVLIVSLTAGDSLCAATKPHPDSALEVKRTWTNADLERLSMIPGLISIVGQAAHQDVLEVDAPSPQLTAWYATQAASLNARLVNEQTNLREFTNAIEDARELKTTTGGINVTDDPIGITPEATIDILQNRVGETQSELDDLEDLARRNNIAPGVLRGQRQAPADKAVAAMEQ